MEIHLKKASCTSIALNQSQYGRLCAEVECFPSRLAGNAHPCLLRGGASAEKGGGGRKDAARRIRIGTQRWERTRLVYEYCIGPIAAGHQIRQRCPSDRLCIQPCHLRASIPERFLSRKEARAQARARDRFRNTRKRTGRKENLSISNTDRKMEPPRTLPPSRILITTHAFMTEIAQKRPDLVSLLDMHSKDDAANVKWFSDPQACLDAI